MKNAPILEWCVVDTPLFPARNNLTASGRLALVLALGTSIALSGVSVASTKVAVKLQGEIIPECAITGNAGAVLNVGAIDLPDITTPGQKDFGFTVNCNAPFDYRLEAKYGALTSRDSGGTSEGLASSVPYDVAIHIPTDGPTIDDRCSGESLRAGQVRCLFSNSGNGIALASQGNLMLAWAPEGTPLAGKYTDKLTVTMGLRQ